MISLCLSLVMSHSLFHMNALFKCWVIGLGLNGFWVFRKFEMFCFVFVFALVNRSGSLFHFLTLSLCVSLYSCIVWLLLCYFCLLLLVLQLCLFYFCISGATILTMIMKYFCWYLHCLSGSMVFALFVWVHVFPLSPLSYCMFFNLFIRLLA